MKKIKKRVNKLGIGIILIILALLLVKEASALGVSPGKKAVHFEPKLRQEVTLTIHNTEQQDFRAVILAEGELEKYIELQQNVIEFSSDEGEKSFSYEIFLPEKFDKPGTHTGDIVIRELPKGGEGDEIIIGALIAVVHKVEVNVPYPGKYAEATFDVISAAQNEDVRFFLHVSNLGEETINSAKAFINIYDMNNNLISIVKSDEKDIPTNKKKELTAKWNANVSVGRYKATAILDYDGVITNLDREFLLGDFFVRLLDISVKKFKLGDIAKFDILAENLAEGEIKGLTAELSLFDNGNSIASLKSPPETLLGKAKKELVIYWETEGLNEGIYEGKLILRYEDKSKEYPIRTKVSKDRIETEVSGITGFAIRAEETNDASLSKEKLLYPLVIILILTNIIIIIYFIKFRKNK